MQNAKNYKPLLYELLDLHNRQKEIANGLIKKIGEADNDAELLTGLQKYLEKIDELEGVLKYIVEPVEISLYKDAADKFDKNREVVN